jgi:hypothetical protein
MECTKNVDWIVDALIDVNTYCEREGLGEISNHLIQAIESVAPILRNMPAACAHTRFSPEHTKVLAVLGQRR